jgi:RND family efflux transporter MFP subunit
MKKIFISIFIVGGIIALIIFKLLSNKKEVDANRQFVSVAAPIAVNVVAAKRQLPEVVVNLVGNTEAVRQVRVPSRSSGAIVSANFKVGDYVSTGSILARVDDTYAGLSLQTATINHDKLADDLRRFQALRAGDAVTETQLRDIQIALETAKVQMQQAQKQIDDTYIRAPFGGYITGRDVEIGQFVGVGTNIASVADIAQLKIVISVSEAIAYKLIKGQDVKITTAVYPGVTFMGKIISIAPQGNNINSYPIEIQLSNTAKHTLKAGTYVNVSIEMQQSEPVILIPRDAIVSSVRTPSVYKIENGNVARLVNITIGASYDNAIEVAYGLQEGDIVVVSGQINLMDGATVITN